MWALNTSARDTRLKLLGRYYQTAALGWFEPKSLHWAKVVTHTGYWKWIRASNGIRGKLLKEPPLHVYQTVHAIRSSEPPRGSRTSGYFLGGSLLFDIDLLERGKPFSLWCIVEAADKIEELREIVSDYGIGTLGRVAFSGSRGVHVSFSNENQVSVDLNKESDLWMLRSFKKSQSQLARSIGYWCKGWDWKVTADIWRVSRVPWSIHGTSSLRAVPLNPPFHMKHVREQMTQATVFSATRNLNIRTTRSIPAFTFVNGETYGPFSKEWATKLPISVALHLIWQDCAKPRETGPSTVDGWFAEDWQILFRYGASKASMPSSPKEGLRNG